MLRSTLVAGDTLSIRQSLSDYPASAGWVLKLRLVPRATGAAVTITCSASGDEHVATVAAATTAGWPAGTYSWAAWVEQGSTAYTVDSGAVEVKADPRTIVSGTDTRSQAQRALDDARAAFAAWSPTAKSYTIGGRSMTFNAPGEIIQVIEHWQREVQREAAADELAAGMGTRRGKVYVRMGRA